MDTINTFEESPSQIVVASRNSKRKQAEKGRDSKRGRSPCLPPGYNGYRWSRIRNPQGSSSCSKGFLDHDLHRTTSSALVRSPNICACLIAKAPSPQSTKSRSPTKRQRSPKPRAAPSRTSKRLKGESADPDDLVALPGTWISSLAGATSKPGETFPFGWRSNLPRPRCAADRNLEPRGVPSAGWL